MSEFTRNFDGIAHDCVGMRIVSEDGTPLTYAVLLSGIVKQRWKGEESLDYKQLYERGKLAARIHKGGDLELAVEEITLLHRLIELSQLAPGQAFGLLAILKGDEPPEPAAINQNGLSASRRPMPA